MTGPTKKARFCGLFSERQIVYKLYHGCAHCISLFLSSSSNNCNFMRFLIIAFRRSPTYPGLSLHAKGITS